MEIKKSLCYLKELEGKPLLYADTSRLDNIKYIIEYDHNLFCLLTVGTNGNISSVLPHWCENSDLLLFFRDSYWTDCHRESVNTQYVQRVNPDCENQIIGLIPMEMLNVYMKNYVDV